MRLKTKRLLIRSIMASDVLPLAEMWSDPDVTRYMGGPRNLESLLEDFEEEARDADSHPFDLWPVVEMASGEVIGHCGLLEKEVDGHPEIELIYVFRSPAWGNGYATEAAAALRGYAFGQLGLQRIIALIDPENQASGRVAEKVGMTFEKKTVRPNGKLVHVYSMQRGSDQCLNQTSTEPLLNLHP